MRLKSAIAVFVLGLVALFLGIGQKTFWAPPERVSVALPSSVQQAPLTVVDPAFAKFGDGKVDLDIKGEGSFTVAVGRPDDVAAWVDKTAHNTVKGADAEGKALDVQHVDGDAKAPNPATADIWASTQSGNGELKFAWSAPEKGDWSLVIASDGTKPAPSQLEFSYANDTSTPWSVPLMVLGGLLMLGALLFAFLFGKGGSTPAKATAADGATTSGDADTVVAAPASEASDAETTATEEKTADIAEPKNAEPKDKPSAFQRIPAIAGALSLAVAGALGAAVPAHAENSPSSPAASDAGSGAVPVVTDDQLKRILASTADAVSTADAAKNAKDLGDRATGEALTIRTQNYKIRASASSHPAVAPVAAQKLLTQVVPTDRAWPRTVTAVTQGAKNPTPLILTLTQKSARENYKLVSASYLLPGNTFPAMSADGVKTLDAKSANGLTASPTDAIAALVARLKDPNGSAKLKFGDNTYFQQAEQQKKDAIDPKNNGANVKPGFDYKLLGQPDAVFQSDDGGAVVVADLEFTITLQPTNDGDTVDLSDQAVATLAGTKKTNKKVTQHFIDSVTLRIPPAGSKESFTLLSADRYLTGVKLG
ncbi:hypothetical protein [Arthrobacter sp. Y-9]|uniref:hypothetical protein n=1 Tax=Arthrobacter sp. Y-9 TaxID=3039385 RepID=UPI00241FDC25|nr:hypothetical protein [Arthrobacter sp. Y-9]WFR83005.1 hypothetical protein P9849_10565 [Arthrobacter sp. Y-9]